MPGGNDWRSTAVDLPGLTEYINQQIALGRIGGTLASALAAGVNAADWRASARVTNDGLVDFINQQIALGKISAIPAALSAVSVPPDARDWRAASLRTGDSLCDYINQQIALGRIAAGVSPPGSPIIWWDGQDIDGTGNSSLVDGATFSSWKNKGSLGVAADLGQASAPARLIFRKVAAAAKLNNLSGVEGTGTQYMFTPSFTNQPQILTGAVIMRAAHTAGQFVLFGGGAGGGFQEFTASDAITLFAGSAAGSALSLTPNTFQLFGGICNSGSSTVTVDNTTSGALAAGSQGLTQMAIMADPVGTTPTVGFFIEAVFYTGGAAPTMAQLRTYYATKYGATPQ